MKKKIKFVFMVLLAFFVIYNIITLLGRNKSTIIAQLDTIELTKSFEGIISRNEQYVTYDVPEGGMLDFSVTEHEMIKKGKLIAVCYDSEIDEAKKKKLSEINKKIAEINSSPSSVGALEIDPDKLDKQIGEKTAQIINVAPKRDVTAVTALKEEVNLLLGRKLTTSGNTEVAADTLESLRLEKLAIEREYGGKKTEITSPLHGILSTNIDGYEQVLTAKKALSMTVADFETVKNGGARKEAGKDVIAKVTDNTSWWLSIIADEKDAREFSVGDSVSFRLGADGDKVKAKVEYISMPDGGRRVISFVTEDCCDLFLSSRVVSVVAVKNSYTGFKIPLSAIHVRKNSAGVYVRTDAGVKFREIDVIYKDDKFAIAKMDNLKPNGLLLYDEIVVDWEG